MASEKVKVFSDDNFESEVINAGVPVVVDFWAEWCGPCQMVGPIIDELAADYEGRAVVGKYNVDQNTQYAQQFGIRGIPTVMIFKNGQIVDKVVGFTPKPEMAKKIDAAL